MNMNVWQESEKPKREMFQLFEALLEEESVSCGGNGTEPQAEWVNHNQILQRKILFYTFAQCIQ